MYSLFHIAGNSEHLQSRLGDVEILRIFRISRKLAPDGPRVVLIWGVFFFVCNALPYSRSIWRFRQIGRLAKSLGMRNSYIAMLYTRCIAGLGIAVRLLTAELKFVRKRRKLGREKRYFREDVIDIIHHTRWEIAAHLIRRATEKS